MVNSVEDVIRVSKEIVNPDNKDDRYTLYLASKYLKENMELFTNKDLFEIFKNYSFFKNNLTNEISLDMLSYAVETNQLFNDVIPYWFAGERKIRNMDTLKEYFDIINKNNDYKQFIGFANYMDLNRFFREFSFQGDMFIKYMVDLSDQNIFFIKDLNKEKLRKIIKECDVDIVNLIYSNKFKKLSDESKDLILNSFFDIWNNKKEITIKDLDDFIILPVEFYKYFKEKDGDNFKKFLSNRIKYVEDEDSRFFNKIECNVLQYIFLNKNDEPMQLMNDIFIDMKSILLDDFIKNTEVYSERVNFIKYAFQEKKMIPLSLFSVDDNILSDDEKNMILSISIVHLMDNYDEKNKYNDWTMYNVSKAKKKDLEDCLSRVKSGIGTNFKKFLKQVTEFNKLKKELPMKSSSSGGHKVKKI